jgi:hypothetical protein
MRHSPQRSVSMSTYGSRGVGLKSISSTSNQNKPFHRELSDEESILKFSRSPARRREYEIAATRAMQQQQQQQQHHSQADAEKRHPIQPLSPRRTTSQSPTRTIVRQAYQSLPLSPSRRIHQEKQETVLRKELDDLQDHLGRVVASQAVLSKRVEKKQQALHSTTRDLEEMKKTIQIQSDHITFVESCLEKRDEEIAKLKQALERSKKMCSKLELDLEVHEIKFSIYDDYRRLMDKQRLDSRVVDSEDHSTDLERAKINNQEQDYLSILSKLEGLESTYKESLSDSIMRNAELQDQYVEAMQEIARLQAAAGIDEEAREEATGSFSSTGVTVPEIESKSDYSNQTVVELLKKRIAILEADARKASEGMKNLQEEVEKSRSMQNDMTVFTNANELSILRLEKDGLRKRISALETEIGFTSGQVDDKTRTRRYRALEKNLNDYIVEIMSLEDKLRAKDSAISALKSKQLGRRLASDDAISSMSDYKTGQSASKRKETCQHPTDVRSRLHQKVEELKSKSKKLTQKREERGDSSSRIASIRQRLHALGASSIAGVSTVLESSSEDDQFDGVEI